MLRAELIFLGSLYFWCLCLAGLGKIKLRFFCFFCFGKIKLPMPEMLIAGYLIPPRGLGLSFPDAE